MPRLSLGLGVQNIRKASGGAAPSGIPVASTSTIIVVSTNIFIGSGTFNKSDATRYDGGANTLDYIDGAWTFNSDGSPIAFATSPAGYIPASGYTIIDGGGSFTITAA